MKDWPESVAASAMRPETERLLLVGDWPPPPGGVSTHLAGLARELDRRGVATTVLDIGRGSHRDAAVVPAGAPPVFTARLARLVAGSALVHLHTSGANPKSWALAAVVGLVARLERRPALLTLHSGQAPPWLSRARRAVVARTVLAAFDAVVCVSDEIDRVLSRLGAADGRRHTIPAFTGLDPVTARKVLPLVLEGAKPLYGAMLGQGPHYGAGDLLAAMALVRRRRPRAGLVVFGTGTRSPEVDAAIARHGVEPVRLGPLPHEATVALLARCDVFVRPTHLDGDAVSLREALALGTRTVATRVGHRPDGVTLCRPFDPPDLARAMEEALSAPPAPASGASGLAPLLALYAATLATRREPADGHRLLLERLGRGPALENTPHAAGRA
jgi:glycogen(starch) synthase